MNQFSKEIQEELNRIGKKYKITKAMILFQEEDVKEKGKINSRFMVFGDEPVFKECEFAHLLSDVHKVSKTFASIAEHANRHTLQDALIDTILPVVAKKAD